MKKTIERMGKKWQKNLTPEEIKIVCKFILAAHEYKPENLKKLPLGSLKLFDLKAIEKNIESLRWPYFRISPQERTMLESIYTKTTAEIARRSKIGKSSPQV